MDTPRAAAIVLAVFAAAVLVAEAALRVRMEKRLAKEEFGG